MNCLSFRQETLAAPQVCHEQLAVHAAECPSCAAFRRSALQSNLNLERALKIPVPECLTARILMRQATRSRLATFRPIAASILIFVTLLVLGAGIVANLEPRQDWITAAQTHLSSEHLVGGAPMPALAVDAVLDQIGIRLSADIGSVAALEPCVIGERLGAHLLIDNDGELVTVLIMPKAETTRRATFSTNTGAGMIVPCAHGGSVAVVAQASNTTNSVAQRLALAIEVI